MIFNQNERLFMTRINVINVIFLSDQWLLAEYRELPRVIKQDISIINAPLTYCLGKGHMKWARCHIAFLLSRYKEICDEMIYRGFAVNYPYENLLKYAYKNVKKDLFCGYVPTTLDMNINYNRLLEKYKMKPSFYKWTKREKPIYFN